MTDVRGSQGLDLEAGRSERLPQLQNAGREGGGEGSGTVRVPGGEGGGRGEVFRPRMPKFPLKEKVVVFARFRTISHLRKCL